MTEAEARTVREVIAKARWDHEANTRIERNRYQEVVSMIHSWVCGDLARAEALLDARAEHVRARQAIDATYREIVSPASLVRAVREALAAETPAGVTFGLDAPPAAE